jgi:hypothetical protein
VWLFAPLASYPANQPDKASYQEKKSEKKVGEVRDQAWRPGKIEEVHPN